MIKIQVLMSTYNGDKYLQEQLDSLLNQTDVDIDILVRDDGSKDNTTRILTKNNIKWYTGQNLKPEGSFMDLIFKSGDFDYYAFCDQDDVWDLNKLSIAVKKMNELDSKKPLMYFSNKKIVDSNMNYMYTTKEKRKINLKSGLICNIATGCTVVINKKMMEYLKKYKPKYSEMHDSWIYKLCLSLGGNVIFDQGAYINYRQHDNNVVGIKENIFKKIKRRLKGIIHCNHIRQKMAQEIINGYKNDIPEENLKVLNNFANYNTNKSFKYAMLFDNTYKTGLLRKDLVFKIALLINKI